VSGGSRRWRRRPLSRPPPTHRQRAPRGWAARAVAAAAPLRAGRGGVPRPPAGRPSAAGAAAVADHPPLGRRPAGVGVARPLPLRAAPVGGGRRQRRGGAPPPRGVPCRGPCALFWVFRGARRARLLGGVARPAAAWGAARPRRRSCRRPCGGRVGVQTPGPGAADGPSGAGAARFSAGASVVAVTAAAPAGGGSRAAAARRTPQRDGCRRPVAPVGAAPQCTGAVGAVAVAAGARRSRLEQQSRLFFHHRFSAPVRDD